MIHALPIILLCTVFVAWVKYKLSKLKAPADTTSDRRNEKYYYLNDSMKNEYSQGGNHE